MIFVLNLDLVLLSFGLDLALTPLRLGPDSTLSSPGLRLALDLTMLVLTQSNSCLVPLYILLPLYSGPQNHASCFVSGKITIVLLFGILFTCWSISITMLYKCH